MKSGMEVEMEMVMRMGMGMEMELERGNWVRGFEAGKMGYNRIEVIPVVKTRRETRENEE